MKKTILIAVGINLLITGFAMASVYVTQFADVKTDSYYKASVDNMVFKGVVKGYNDGLFHPDDAVTRAQAVTMLDRYDEQLLARITYLENMLCKGFNASSSTDASFTEAYQKICEAPAV
jgi:hypothetical protein